jgi:glycosyltransferase involved in cell wall biosynthesis
MKVTAIVPCYNTAEFIGDCLESLLFQGDCIDEIICVDDCSSDSTPLVLERYRQDHPTKITVLKNEKNKGAAYSRNRALKQAKGEWIQLLDSDDFLLEGKVNHQLLLLANTEKAVSFIAGAYERWFEDGMKTTIAVSSSDLWINLMLTRLGCTCSNLWNKKFLDQIGGFDETLSSSQEYDLMFRLLKTGAPVLIDYKSFTIVRSRTQGSISYTNMADKWKRYVHLRLEMIPYLESVHKLDPIRWQSAYQVIFDAVRVWYQHDKYAALDFFEKKIPPNFIPSRSATTSVNYIRLFRLLGFKRTEWLKSLFR